MKVLCLALIMVFAFLSFTKARRENCALPASNCSSTEKAIIKLIENIQKYGRKKNTLKKGEFIKMVQKELKNMLPVPPNKKSITNLMKSLDVSKDGKINVNEYMSLIANITVKFSQKKRIQEHAVG